MPKMEVQHTHVVVHSVSESDMENLVRALTKGAIITTLIYLGGDTARQVILDAFRRG